MSVGFNTVPKIVVSDKFAVSKNVLELHNFEIILQLYKFFFKWDTFEKCDLVNISCVAKKLFEKSGVAIVMRATEEYLEAVDVV